MRAEAGREPDRKNAEAFVKRLHRSGRITGYQVQALWKDKGRKLSLGNYVIEDELGRGGMGIVLKARHRRMQRLVAVKVLPSSMTKDKDAIARFEREVVAAAQLAHTNIVAAHDADEIDGQHILVMEFVDGRDLSSVVKKQGPLSVEQALDCTIQAARGLEFAHQKGVVHRDIKPANLLLDNEGTVKILDMGLARFSDSANVGTQAELTGTGTVMGTVDYMSPEQAMSTKTADGRSDQYSLGITLWFLLTGEPAFTGDSLMARLMAHANEPIPDLRTKRSEVADNLQSVFARMVAKKPDDRYPSMTEAIADLVACRSDTTGTAVVASAPVTGESPSGVGEGGLTGFLKSLESDAGNSSPSVTQPATAVKQRAKRKQAVTSPSEEATLVSSPTSGTVKTAAWTTSPALSKLPPIFTDWRTLAGAAAACLLLLGAVVFLFRTPNGTLRIEIDDPEIEVSIKGTDIVLKGADTQDVTLTPGEKTLHVKRGDFSFDTTSLQLKRGETVVVKVELLDGELRAMRDGKVVGAKSVRVGEPEGATTDYALEIANKALVELPQIPLDGPYTIECDLQAGPQVPPNGVAFMNSSGDRYTSLFVMENGLPAFGRYEDGVLVCTCGLKDSQHPDDRPLHVAAVWDGREARLYVDGRVVRRGESFRHAAKVRSHVGAAIGAFVHDVPQSPVPQSLLHFTGRVDELRVSSVARYEADFAPPHRHTPDAQTLALYHCDEGSGDVLKDSSGNGHHGKIVGAKWVRVDGTVIPAGNSVTAPPVAEWSEWRSIFDRESLDGWELFDGEPGDWKVVDGVLTGSGKGNKLVYTRERFDDVSVRVECRLSPQTNSGLYVRSGANAKFDDGYEAQLAVPTASGATEKLQTGAVWRFSESTEQLVRAGEWFPVEVEARGRRIRVRVDGRTTADFEDDTFDVGHVALQGLNSGHPIEVRSIAVREPIEASSKGGGLRFDGVDDHVVLPRVPWDGGPFTVEAVVQAGDQAFPNGVVVALNSGTGLAILNFDTAGVPVFGRMDGPTLQSTSDGGQKNRAATRPTHVTATWNGKEAMLFLDGKLAARGVGGTYTPRGVYGIQALIGAILQGGAGEEAPTSFLNGTIHELRLSSVARYSADHDPVDHFEPDEQTLALYHFDEGSGDVLKDSSGHGHHGKIVGAKWVRAGTDKTVAPSTGSALDLSNKGHVALPVKLSGETPVTVEMWVTPRHVADDHVSRRLWEAGAIELKQFGGNWDLVGVNRPGVEVAERLVSSWGSCVAGRRTHLVAVLTGEELALFVDGKLAGRKAYAALPDSNRPMFLGSPSYDDGDSGYQPFDGTFDEIRLSHGVRYTENFEPPDHFETDDRTWMLYHCDEGAGDVLKDSSVNGHDGTIVGAKWVWAGAPATDRGEPTRTHALEFDGEGDHVELPSLRYPGGPYTAECWIELDDSGGPDRYRPLLSWVGDDGHVSLVINATRRVRFEHVDENGPDSIVQMSQRVPFGRHHMAVVWDGSVGRLFVDGSQLGQTKAEPEAPVVEHASSLGGWPDETRDIDYRGRISAARFSSIARYAEPFAPPTELASDAHTLALYQFDEGSGDVLKDSSVNGHDGKIVGAKWVRVDGSVGDVSPPSNSAGSVRIDLLREHPLTGGGSATKQADGTWKSWTGGKLESSRSVAGDYRVELVFVQTGGFDADLGLVLPVGGTQVELVVPDEVLARSRPSRLELVDGKSLVTKPVHFGKGQSENLLIAEVRREGGRWRIRASFGDEELIDRVFDEAQLSLTPSRRLSQADHIGVHLAKMAVDIKSLTLFVPDDGSTAPVGDPPPPAVAPFDEKQAKAHQAAWAKHLGVPVEFTNKVGMTFVLVPPGEFLMGADPQAIDPAKLEAMLPDVGQRNDFVAHVNRAAPRHRVRITRPFYVQTREVTGENLRRVVGTVPEDNPSSGVVKRNVGLGDAVTFCNALSKLESRPVAYRTGAEPPSRILDATGYRLPTEAEWEYACRAGTTTPWYFGDDPHGPRGRLSNLQDQQTDQRGQLAKPNPFGLFDVYAGSSEWCFDRFEPYTAEEAVDPFTEPGDTFGVVRGSSDFAGGGGDLGTVNSFNRETINEDGPTWCGFGRVVLPIPYTPPASTAANDAGDPGAATIVPLVELNRGDYNTAPWPSRDGLRLYWEATDDAGDWEGAKTVMAARTDVTTPFGKPRVVADGRMATLSPDELELICVPGGTNAALHITRRRSIDDAFPALVLLDLPNAPVNPKSPQFSAQGVRLVVQEGRPGAIAFRSWTRDQPGSDWRDAGTLGGMHERDHGGFITWPYLADDRLRIWYGRGGNRETEIWTGTRRSTTDPFGDFEAVTVDGKPLVGRAPRYVASTRELFFARPVGKQGWELAVVRNYAPGE